MLVTVVLVSFLACAVEMVEALTIVLAAGVTRGFKSALAGAGLAIVILLAIIIVAGISILKFVPIDVFRVVLGIFLMLFGLKWLKAAILRYSGLKALHQEDAIYAKRLVQLGSATSKPGLDAAGFATAFNGTLLEGLEVALIIVAVGTSSGSLSSAAVGAVAAFVVVTLAGVILRNPLSKVPENLLKYVVGIMLSTFGTFWAGEGLGVAWIGKDFSVLGLIAAFLLMSFALIRWLQRPQPVANIKGQEVVP